MSGRSGTTAPATGACCRAYEYVRNTKYSVFIRRSGICKGKSREATGTEWGENGANNRVKRGSQCTPGCFALACSYLLAPRVRFGSDRRRFHFGLVTFWDSVIQCFCTGPVRSWRTGISGGCRAVLFQTLGRGMNATRRSRF